MDRKSQLGNVAFGGAWSERIADDEDLVKALTILEDAVIRTIDEDLRSDEALSSALARTAAEHPKGAMLSRAWTRALSMTNPALRSGELKRIAEAIRLGVGLG